MRHAQIVYSAYYSFVRHAQFLYFPADTHVPCLAFRKVRPEKLTTLKCPLLLETVIYMTLDLSKSEQEDRL